MAEERPYGSPTFGFLYSTRRRVVAPRLRARFSVARFSVARQRAGENRERRRARSFRSPFLPRFWRALISSAVCATTSRHECARRGLSNYDCKSGSYGFSRLPHISRRRYLSENLISPRLRNGNGVRVHTRRGELDSRRGAREILIISPLSGL